MISSIMTQHRPPDIHRSNAATHYLSSALSRCYNAIQKVGKLQIDFLPQHFPLLLALFCSFVAVFFSVRVHSSPDFVLLKDPINVGRYFKKIYRVGITSWNLCSANDLNEYSSFSIFTNTENEFHDDNFTTFVRSVYHYDHTSTHDAKTISWMMEPNHDDSIVVPSDIPFGDDDSTSEAQSFWKCHRIRLPSRYVQKDIIWTISCMSNMLGSMIGVTSTILLLALYFRRVRRVNDVERQKKVRTALKMQFDDIDVGDQQENINIRQCLNDEATKLAMLDTVCTGYHPISACFFISYLFQSITFIYLESELCRNQACSLSDGAHALIISCSMLAVSGLFCMWMMRKTVRNELIIRNFKMMHANTKANDEVGTV
mmetsp:Transcript_9064/g.18818  ORF Transcript_9064/g.18818 Transcript_9064/m.18818 type:complete len:372 (+) Transcript_9064:81-1196(+)